MKGNHEATGKKAVPDIPIDLDLSTIQTTVKSLGAVIQSYAKGTSGLKESQFSRLTWAIHIYSSILRSAEDASLEDQLTEIKAIILQEFGVKIGEKNKQKSILKIESPKIKEGI